MASSAVIRSTRKVLENFVPNIATLHTCCIGPSATFKVRSPTLVHAQKLSIVACPIAFETLLVEVLHNRPERGCAPCCVLEIPMHLKFQVSDRLEGLGSSTQN